MSARKSAVPSPEAIARSQRQRLAAEEGVRAIADVERQGLEVRKNMARLRELRQAKEAADAAAAEAMPAPAPKKRARKSPK
ncbi:transcriptional regulator [Bradyrhizobium sp. WYCCWR 13023]|uniref:Transcriptional regulator n=1 Tax=Bradyrhizobium zhengyangense TaxID=2911009 RepID=A0A9X1RB10_9BRAD|nr:MULTISPECIES: transcriptional regulator [Bradyrhizobium]MCG2629151.1 transcriptional regulator [Bradyrhizobium zhengyangense]MCG2640867.1 transcriptional regulator [Bradyrhizobium zhengyangense]MCG2670708.1 transcriptional regulator [Bradyrhizobium zhengyangense]MDA9522495.1 transcriptional regulator [Bradyrhizobium sp. CCBAU 11434]